MEGGKLIPECIFGMLSNGFSTHVFRDCGRTIDDVNKKIKRSKKSKMMHYQPPIWLPACNKQLTGIMKRTVSTI